MGGQRWDGVVDDVSISYFDLGKATMPLTVVEPVMIELGMAQMRSRQLVLRKVGG